MKRVLHDNRHGFVFLGSAIAIAIIVIGGIVVAEVYFPENPSQKYQDVSDGVVTSTTKEKSSLTVLQDSENENDTEKTEKSEKTTTDEGGFIEVQANGSNDLTVSKGARVVVKWQGRGVENCTRSGRGENAWPSGSVSQSGSFVLSNVSYSGSAEFEVSCTKNGNVIHDSVTVNVVSSSGDVNEPVVPPPTPPSDAPLEEHDAYTVLEYEGTVGEGDTVVNREIAASQFYRSHNDDYDFLIFLSAIPTNRQAGSGFPASPYPGGIAAFDFSDQTEKYGSDGRLLSVSFLPPSLWIDVDRSEMVHWVLHELSHYWLMFFGDSEKCATNPDASIKCDDASTGFPVNSNGAHWRSNIVTAVRDNGLLYPSPNGGGPALQITPEGRCGSILPYTGEGDRFNDIELYLMGLISPAQADPVKWYTHDSAFNEKLGGSLCTEHTLTPNDIIENEGPRIPAYPNAKTDFRARFILLVAPEQDVLPSYREKMEYISNNFGNIWSRTTRGHSTMETF